MISMAAKANLTIRVAARLNSSQWSSAQRGDIHNQKIADTIIGDCIAALQYISGQPVTRTDKGITYMGYRNI